MVKHDAVIAFAGNPNVGKSTIFNTLTGMHRHTGNWSGKTVSNAFGVCRQKNTEYMLADLPGCYSLYSRSAEEEIARDFILFGNPDAVCIVCDATCLEKNLNLVFQVLEISKKAFVCVNMTDEAKKRGITIDYKKLSEILSVPVIPTSARNGKNLSAILKTASDLKENSFKKINYPAELLKAIDIISKPLRRFEEKISLPWLSLALLAEENDVLSAASEYLGYDLFSDSDIISAVFEARNKLGPEYKIQEETVGAFLKGAEDAAHKVIFNQPDIPNISADKILTSPVFAYPLMFLTLAVVFWITLVGANVISDFLGKYLSAFENILLSLCETLGITCFITDMLIRGAYGVLSRVIAVMLPPMAIFFPLFSLLEDLGWLPRVAFNLDGIFKRCSACGKQALTMCMGFGCNAVGVSGTRIIDSRRERLIAIITNSFVPCNGRFPALIAISSMFFSPKGESSVFTALFLALTVCVSIGLTLLASFILSKTLLKGEPSAFVLELPPLRKPQIIKTLVQSFRDKTLFVLGRAACVAAPCGIIIFLLSNIYLGGASLITHAANFLNPFASLLGLDGVILLSFILALPANEIVIPIMIMGYTASNLLMGFENLEALHSLLLQNAWTIKTALCFIAFTIMHWPCSTTLQTIKKETGSSKWTLISFAVPALMGLIICFIINFLC